MKKGLAIITAALAIFALVGTVMAADIDWSTVNVTDVTGKVQTAKDFFHGAPVILAFAQTACVSCRDEIMFLNSIMKDYPNVSFDAVMVDLMTTPDRVKNYLEGLGFKGQILLDPQMALGQKVGVSVSPACVIIGKDGKIVLSTSGYNPDVKKILLEGLKKVN